MSMEVPGAWSDRWRSFLARAGNGLFRRGDSFGRESRRKYSVPVRRPIGIRLPADVCAPGIGCLDRSLSGGLACRRCRPEALYGGVTALGSRLVSGYPQGSDGDIGKSRSVQTSYPQKPLENRSVNVRIHSGRIEDICGAPDQPSKLFHTAQNCARVLRTVMHLLSP
ncbi:protein of unknown function [Burkholderia multivorans]